MTLWLLAVQSSLPTQPTVVWRVQWVAGDDGIFNGIMPYPATIEIEIKQTIHKT